MTSWSDSRSQPNGASGGTFGKEDTPEEDKKEQDGGLSDYTPVAELRRGPKDPRSKAKYNIFSRLLFW